MIFLRCLRKGLIPRRNIIQCNKRPSLWRIYSRAAGEVANLPSSSILLQNDNKAKVVLLGTVHFSKQSVEDVSKIVKSLNPNAILIELCRQRVSLLELDDKKFLEDAKKFDAKKIKQAVKGQGLVSGMLHAMLLKTYADIARELGVAPGGEFRRAYQEVFFIYDEKVRLWDTRNLKRCITEKDVNGGVWRLKWHPYNKNIVVAACMYGGFRILNIREEINIISEYLEHESIAYGADWKYDDKLSMVATCSFYDCTLHVGIVDL